MTWSLALQAGDLSVSGPGGLATVSGQAKLVQDLRDWLLEPRGTDPMHSEYGSILDGGVLADGSIATGAIGGIINDETLASIEGEIRRILNAYQQQQVARINSETILYAGKNTYSLGELLASINSITFQQIFSTIIVTISITTANGDNLSFSQPLS